MKEISEREEILYDLSSLDILVYRLDVPHPACQEYVELHEKMQKIRERISILIRKYEER